MKHFDQVLGKYVESDVGGFVQDIGQGQGKKPILRTAMEEFRLGAPLHDLLVAQAREQEQEDKRCQK